MKAPTVILEIWAQRFWRYLIIACIAALVFYVVGWPHSTSSTIYEWGHEHSASKWLLGISYELIGAIIVALLIDHHFSVLGIKEHENLNFISFFARTARAQECVRILDIWMKSILLVEARRKRFKRALLAASRNNVHDVTFIVVDPNSEAAKGRASQLAGKGDFAGQSQEDILADMRRCVDLLVELRNEVCMPCKPSLLDAVIGKRPTCFRPEQVKILVLQEAPALAVHEVDGFAYFAFFPSTTVSAQAPQISANSYRRAGSVFFAQFRQIIESAVPLQT